MKNKILFVTGILICICLCACSHFESLVTLSPAEETNQAFNPSEKSEEAIEFEVRAIPAYFDENNDLEKVFNSTDTVQLSWTPYNGYSMVDYGKTTDQYSVGIKNAEGNLILDYLYLIHTDDIDLIDYESSISMRMELFSQVVNSKNHKCFISAMSNGGGGWADKNAISEASDPYYGYLLVCIVKLSENDFLNFTYYFKSDALFKTCDDVPSEIKDEVLLLMDSFQIT